MVSCSVVVAVVVTVAVSVSVSLIVTVTGPPVVTEGTSVTTAPAFGRTVAPGKPPFPRDVCFVV